jgi:RNA polymerase sigma-70 factor (ECF subfamily)
MHAPCIVSDDGLFGAPAIARLIRSRISSMDERTRMAHVKKAVGGDPDALQLLLIERHNSLLAVVRARLPVSLGRYVDPDDVVQETYIRAFSGVTSCQFDSAAAFHAWLEGVAVNTLRDQERFLRRRKRDVLRNVEGSARPSESYDRLFERITVCDSTPSRKLAKVEAAAAVLSSLARLTGDQREVIRLRFLEGWPVPEVADHLDKTEAAVHMLCHRGLTNLREILLSMSRFL